MKISSSKVLNVSKVIILTIIIGFSVNYVFAVWTNPPANPPTCPDTIDGCNTPINVSINGQIKEGGLTLNTNGSQHGLIVQKGNVGIGTITPSNKLTINGGASSGINDVLRISGGSLTAANDATGLLFLQRDFYNDYGAAIRLVNTASTPSWLNPRLDFGVQNPNTNTQANIGVKMSILGNGNIGIGTISPTQKLDVIGTVKTTGLQVTGGTPGVGKVLTSDANGVGTWQTSASGGGSSSIQLGPIVEYKNKIIVENPWGSGTVTAQQIRDSSCPDGYVMVGLNLYNMGQNFSNKGSLYCREIVSITKDNNITPAAAVSAPPIYVDPVNSTYSPPTGNPYGGSYQIP